jgi:hypothetical protein
MHIFRSSKTAELKVENSARTTLPLAIALLEVTKKLTLNLQHTLYAGLLPSLSPCTPPLVSFGVPAIEIMENM